MESKHPNSKKIVIYRAQSFLSRAQGPEVDNYYATTHAAVGSYWLKGSQQIATGLTVPEIRLLLPALIGIPATDNQFLSAVNRFYGDLTTPVPFKEGRTLEIGLMQDNSKPISEENLPLNIMDYVRYHQIKGHPFVAKDLKEAKKDSRKQFYIFDKEAANDALVAENRSKDAAMQIYMQMKGSEAKRDMMLELIGEKYEDLTSSERDTLFRNCADKKHTKFYEIYQQGDIEERYKINRLIHHKLLEYLAGKYIIAGSKKLIGSSIKEAIMFLKDDENSETILHLNTSLMEKEQGLKLH